MQNKRIMNLIENFYEGLIEILNDRSDMCILLSVPVDVLEDAGICTEDTLQFYAEDGKIIIETVENATNYKCDDDCENCPYSDNYDERKVE